VRGAVSAAAWQPPEIPDSLATPDQVESRIGTLEFEDGTPSEATLETVYDNLDFTYAFRAFVDTMQGVSRQAFLKIKCCAHRLNPPSNSVVQDSAR